MSPFRPHLILLAVMLLLITACSISDSDTDSGGPQSRPTADVPDGFARVELQAGEIDDNATWTDYLAYRQGYFIRRGDGVVAEADVAQRQIIMVTDAAGYPLLDARVSVFDEQQLIVETRTAADGRAFFFPTAWLEQPETYRVVVEKNQVVVQFQLDPQFSMTWHVPLQTETEQAQATQLDVLFLLDATASMGDEIRQLQTTILSISEQVEGLAPNLDVRYGLVNYRDHGDSYVTQVHDFVCDVGDFQQSLADVSAGEGGDIPEALNEALADSVDRVSWREGETIRLIFLVADAEPHLYQQSDQMYNESMVRAAWKGIKIHSIASSSLSDDGEFVFRQLAQYTGGHFIFLTYRGGAGGAPGSQRTDLEAGQGNYTVEALDDLVLRLIAEEVAAISQQIQVNGVVPQMESVAALPAYDPPPSFAFGRYTPEARLEELSSGRILRSVAGGLLVVVFMLPFMLLMIFIVRNNAHYRPPKRKNKNDYFYSEE